MRDDRYRGTSLSRQVRKLCRMSEREADQAQPERLRRQAVVALVSDANREISPEFRRRLREHDAVPGFFGAGELAAAARSGFEADIARAVVIGRGVDAIDAISNALRHRSDAYLREQRCQLVADRCPDATKASASVQKACDEALLVAATFIFDGCSPPKVSQRPMLTENLLAQPRPGAAL